MLPSNMQELAQFKNWIVSGADKVPWRVDGKARASSTDPNDWDTYEAAAALCAQHPELTPGFVLTNTPYTCIDLDATDDASAQRTHTEIYNRFNSCTEISMSGKGAHIWIKGAIPEGVRSTRHKIEVYSTDRYIKITGNVANSTQIMERQALLTELFNEIRSIQGATDTGIAIESQPQVNSDEQIYKAATQAANGDKFVKLYAGDFVADYQSHSEADMALCNILAFYSDNKNQVARMWAASPLGQSQPKRTRKKWVQDMVNKSFDQKVVPMTTEQRVMFERQLKEEIETTKETDSSSMYEDWTLPPGVVGEIAKFIYNAAHSPIKEVALAGAIAYYAGLMGRTYNVSGMGLNQYIVMLGKTGIGKEAANTGINKINQALQAMLGKGIDINWFMGPGRIASAQGILNRISETPCCVSILGEFGDMLEELCDPRGGPTAKNIRSALTKLYTSSGKSGIIGSSAYSDKAKNGQTIDAPAFSIFGESNPTSFYEAVDERTIKQGFLTRLTIIQYDGESTSKNKKAHFVQPDPSLILKLNIQVRENQDRQALNETIEVGFTYEAQAFYEQLDLKCDLETKSHDEEHLRNIWTRVSVKVIKLAALIAVGVDSIKPVISLQDITWAENLVMVGTNKLLARFKSGDVGISPVESKHYAILENALMSYLKKPWNDKSEHNFSVCESAKRVGIIHHTYLDKTLGGLKEFRFAHNVNTALPNIIKRFVDGGRLVVVSDGDIAMRQTSKGGLRTGKMYRIVL